MTKEFKIGDEPVPGYRLGKFLGRGGFGEVWRAVGPGGTEVALKSIALDRKQGMKEFRSLRLVKRIHHPNLVPILAFWLIDSEGHPLDDENIDLLGSNIIDSRGGPNAVAVTATMQFNAARPELLIIAMGLGEKNLLDVLKDHQAKGLPGIPLEELLDYMEGSARAIDFLNTARHNLGGDQPVAIQHCDIKPQNIMLVGDAVQVCDFGLARSLTDVRSTSVAGSIAFGAPELFWENKPTHATDQYSLAITYYELRTGQLPFGPDMAAIEVMQAHRDGKLDLHHLNDAERSVIKRATTPAPAGRFEKTIDMVRALRRATQDGALVVSPEGSRPAAAGIRSSIVQTGREIVPGYTLLEHLFHPDVRTDVWSASAPGGKPQAIWLYDLTSYAGSIDRDALRSIQALTDHPRLARINGWWVLNKSGLDITTTPASLSTLATSVEEAMPTTLVIASELTRTNLAHRVEECRQFRGKGIPVEELISYMQQIAEGVDALNDASHALRGSRWASLVHTDLRPANLLVFGQVVKIGNFAWCRTLEGEEAEASGMPVRASRPTMAPELVAGRINRRTDQYALAATYVQMRTGDMLFESGLPTGAASGALAGVALDFSALSEGEAQVIHRAMHADPQQRYPSCRKMVAELVL
ncbi:MAG TPA: protein kinase, partial [Pirellulales bacterium]|nr:protein kinase [Pirellulales bacterium]